MNLRKFIYAEDVTDTFPRIVISRAQFHVSVFNSSRLVLTRGRLGNRNPFLSVCRKQV